MKDIENLPYDFIDINRGGQIEGVKSQIQSKINSTYF